MEIQNNQEVTKELGKNQFSEIAEALELQQSPTIQQAPKPPENKEAQIPPKEQQNSDEVLIGIYLKKENKTMDYYYNKEQIDLILYNKNLIVGMLENIKLDVLLGEKPKE